MRFHRFVTPSLENPTGLIMYWDGLKKPLTPADSCGSRNNRPPSPSCDMPPTKPSPTPDPKPKPKPDPEPDPKPKKKVKKTTKNKFKKNKFKAEDNSNNNVGNNGDVTNNNSN